MKRVENYRVLGEWEEVVGAGSASLQMPMPSSEFYLGEYEEFLVSSTESDTRVFQRPVEVTVNGKKELVYERKVVTTTYERPAINKRLVKAFLEEPVAFMPRK